MKICKIFTFDAAHKLPDEECYGACRNLHGHQWTLEVEVEGPVTDKGWVMNFKDLKKTVSEIVDELDHSYLNDKYPITTAECMSTSLACEIDSHLPEGVELSRLVLWETPTSCVTVTRDDL